MILIIHGNDTTTSRNFYFEEKNKLKNPIFLNGDGLTYEQVFQSLESKSFFEEAPAIIIENFFSKNKSNTNEFKKISSYLNDNKNINIIIWENSEVSKTSLSQINNATVRGFSFPQNLFLFLDSIKPNSPQGLISLFHKLQSTMEPELILFMMIRQFRLLLALSASGQDKIDEVKKLAPWQIGKLKKQSEYFTPDYLKKVYADLLLMDLNHKTGKISLPIEKSIDFFLVGL